MMKAVKFEQIGRNCFEPGKAIMFPQYKLEMWPGFDVRLTNKEAGLFLNIEPCHKVVRHETALDVIRQVMQRCQAYGQDFKKEVLKEFQGNFGVVTVVTKYNNKTYQVCSVAFDKTPKSTFVTSTQISRSVPSDPEVSDKKGSQEEVKRSSKATAADDEEGAFEISFVDYYKNRYNEEILDLTQPLLVSANKRTGEVTYLVPELCRMTGLTPALLADFRTMREIKAISHSDAPVKVKECLKLFSSLKESKECRDLMEDMEINFVKTPFKVPAVKLTAGNMLMGRDEKDRRISHDIECCGRDLDRKV